MPSDFANRDPNTHRKTLADLIRQLSDGPRTARPAYTTSPIAGPGRIRDAQQVRQQNRETEIERRRRLANEALRRLKER